MHSVEYMENTRLKILAKTKPTLPEEAGGTPPRPSFGHISSIVVMACCLLFLLCGLAVIPYPGIQNDEALFAAPLYAPKSNLASVSAMHLRIPIMQMSYLGCFKAWVYKPIFASWSPSVWSMRIPVLLFGAVTIYLFWLLMTWTAGHCAAIMTTILLATDTSFLLTTCFDWGPVALQHLLTVGGILALIAFYRLSNERWLGVGFFLFGLALWDKAIFFWSLSGLMFATALVFPRELWKTVNGRRVLIAFLFFTIGASPLLWYNLIQGGKTFGSNAKISMRELPSKLLALVETADGSMFSEFFVANADFKPTQVKPTAFQRSAIAIGHAMPLQRNANAFSFLFAVALLPFLWKTPIRKILLFTLCLIAIVWFQMAITIGAGTGPHHAVLIWPWPMFFIGVTFSAASIRMRKTRKLVLTVVVGWLAVTNVLLTNQYLTQLIENGPGPVWTDAIFPLARYLRMQKTTEIYSVDWGTTNSLRLLDRGALPLQEAAFILRKEVLDQSDQKFLKDMITRSDDVLVAHTSEFEAFPGINDRLNALAATIGFQRLVLGRIFDLHGRPTFEILRFTPQLGKPKLSPRNKLR